MNFQVFMINGLLGEVAGTCTLIHFPCVQARVPMGAKIVSRNNTAEIWYLSHLSIFKLVLLDHEVLDPDADHRGKNRCGSDCASLKQKVTRSGFNSDRGRGFKTQMKRRGPQNEETKRVIREETTPENRQE